MDLVNVLINRMFFDISMYDRLLAKSAKNLDTLIPTCFRISGKAKHTW